MIDGGNLFVGGADSGLKLSGTASGKGLESPDQRRLLLLVLIPATESLNKRAGRVRHNDFHSGVNTSRPLPFCL